MKQPITDMKGLDTLIEGSGKLYNLLGSQISNINLVKWQEPAGQYTIAKMLILISIMLLKCDSLRR